MFKSFSFIFCMVVVSLTVVGFVAGAYHLIPYGTLLPISGALLVAAGTVLGFMALRAHRAHDGEAFVLLGFVGVIDLFAVAMLFGLPAAVQFPFLMMAATMASATASVLLINADRLPCHAACCRN